MPRRNRNRQNTTAPVVRQVGDWLDISAHTEPDLSDPDNPTVYDACMLRISSIKKVQLAAHDTHYDDNDNEIKLYRTEVVLKGDDSECEPFAASAYEMIRRRVLGANPNVELVVDEDAPQETA